MSFFRCFSFSACVLFHKRGKVLRGLFRPGPQDVQQFRKQGLGRRAVAVSRQGHAQDLDAHRALHALDDGAVRSGPVQFQLYHFVFYLFAEVLGFLRCQHG